jgi:hypothetical protein
MKATILLVCVLVAGLALVFWLKQSQKPAEAPNVVETPTIRPDADQPVVSNQSIAELRNLLVADYHSTNEHDAITSALTHELIAERLRTNAVFLDWASNVTKSVILRFVTNGSIPVYGSSGLTADSLQLCKVTANGMVGMYAEAVYDPNTTNEGPLEFIVEGGVHPTLLRVQNSYRLVSYQLSPERWARSQRKIGRMDWSGAVQPLDKEEANTLSRHAFREMTGLDLDSFHLGKTKIDSERILNPVASHPDVTVTGNLNARIYTPKDYLYPFVEFSYDDSDPMHSPFVSFSGQMVQTSPGRGEFVDLFAVVRKTEAVFELAEKFLGQGTWEESMLDNVHSLDTEQRGQIYRRIFQH